MFIERQIVFAPSFSHVLGARTADNRRSAVHSATRESSYDREIVARRSVDACLLRKRFMRTHRGSSRVVIRNPHGSSQCTLFEMDVKFSDCSESCGLVGFEKMIVVTRVQILIICFFWFGCVVFCSNDLLILFFKLNGVFLDSIFEMSERALEHDVSDRRGDL